jgi:branched-chain amino acid transport system substrate-binding protein
MRRLGIGLTMAALLGLAQGAGAETVRIYSSLPLYGPSRPQSEDIVRAMRMALRANDGMAGRFTIDFVSLNDATRRTGFWTAKKVAANARRAAADPAAVAYLGEFNSAATVFSLPILNEAGLLQISPSNTSVGLTRSAGGEPGEPDRYYPTGRRTYGRVVPANHLEARALGALMADERCARVYAVAAAEPYGIGMARLAVRAAHEHGVETRRGPRIGERFEAFRRLARRVKRSDSDCFFFGGPTFLHAPEVFNTVGAANPRLKLFGPDSLAEFEFAHELRPGVRKRVWITNPTLGRRGYPAAGRAFFAAFKARYGHFPEPYAIYGYEAMAVALDAIARAGDAGGPTDAGREAIVDAFFATRNRESVLGTYGIDKHGDTTLSDYGVFRPARGGGITFDRVISSG